MSPNLLPFLAYFIPSKNACFVTSTSLLVSFGTSPTINVLAASPLNPFFSATVSILTISPFFIILFFEK